MTLHPSGDESDPIAQLRDVYDAPLDKQEQAALIRHLGKRVGWDDPEMDAYDDYDAARKRMSQE